MSTTTITSSLLSDGLYINETYVTQTRTSVLVGGVPKFRVVSTVNVNGQLPDLGVFVFAITNTADPSQDTFTRVAQVADLLSLPSTRADAVRRQSIYYRIPQVTLTYDDIETGVTGAATIKDRVNYLVKSWISYKYEFQKGPPGDVYRLPLLSLSTLAELVTRWQKAQAATLTARLYLENAQAALTAKQVELAALVDKQAFATEVTAVLGSAETQSSALADVGEKIIYACSTFGVPPTLFPVDPGNPGLNTAGTGMWGGWNSLLWDLGQANDTLTTVTASNPGIGLEALLATYTALQTRLATLLSTDLSAIHGTTCNATTGIKGVINAAFEDISDQVTAIENTASALEDSRVELNTEVKLQESEVARATRDYDNAVASEENALSAIKQACPTFDQNNPDAALAS